MQQFIDQAIFDSGVLVLGTFGSLEIKKSGTKFSISEFMNFQGLLDTYQKIRPNDLLYKSQTKDSLEWLLHSTPINLDRDNFSQICKVAYEIRKELNADMQPPNLKERIFRGAIFQPESKNYLNRTEESKKNISKIFIQISKDYGDINNNFINLERKINSNSLSYYLTKQSNKFEIGLHKDKNTKINWKTKLHFMCCIASCCYWSLLKRYDNFPTYSMKFSIQKIAIELAEAIRRAVENKIDFDFASKILNFYIDDWLSTTGGLTNKTEGDIWDDIYTEIIFSKYATDGDLEYFLNEISEQVDTYSISDAFDISANAMGIEFLNT